MATICNDPNGRKRILFFDADGNRKTLRLGKVARRHAEAVKVKVEDLAAALVTGHAPADETTHWVANLDDTMRDKLARVGLLAAQPKTTLGTYIDSYMKKRKDVKSSTQLVYGRVRRYLIDFFSEDRPLRSITPGDADDWRLYLMNKGLAENTVRRSCGLAKQWFTAAIRAKLVSENPFTDLTAAVKANTRRWYFISQEEAELVLAACPDVEWRLLFALARYGGLRVPSEIAQLRWIDIDWASSRFTVHSPKTEHHEGHESRMVPIFPRLLPYLQEAFDQAEEGSEYCITRHRTATGNLRTQLTRIIKRAGLQPWPKLWQNLRSTCETELADDFPTHVVTAWIGNSVPVAVKHYLQVTEDHFAQAAQNAAQKPAENTGNERKTETGPQTQTPVSVKIFNSLQDISSHCINNDLEANGRYRT